jgi:hypothetical protein
MTGLYLFFLLLLTVTPLVHFPTPASASIGWADDFNDGNYDGWTINGLYAPVVGDWSITTGKADIVDGELIFTGEQIFRNFSYAIHESTVEYGSWSFDVKVRPISGSSNHTHIYFLDNRPTEEIPDFESPYMAYDVFIYSAPWNVSPPNWMRKYDDTAPSILLVRRSVNTGVIIGNYSVDEINGLYRFNVTREDTGRIRVYVNDTLRIDVVETRTFTPQSFYLTSEAGISYDNIVVSGRTEGGDALVGPMIAVGVGAVITIAALVILKKRQPG